MELFREIRLKIGNANLLKKVARSDDFGSISRFHQKMNDRNIEVKVIGYFPGPNLPDKYTAIRYLTCIRRKELNLFYQPVSEETSRFISNRYDILIDINFKKIFPLLYISSLSNALFKVGLFEYKTLNSPFDLMMEIKSPVDIDNYLAQVIRYLEMINSGKAKQVINK